MKNKSIVITTLINDVVMNKNSFKRNYHECESLMC